MTEPTASDETRRQVLYWRLLARVFGADEQPALETSSVAIVDDLGLPPALLDPSVSVDNLIQRFPDLGPELRDLMTRAEDDADPRDRVRRAALMSKVLLNVFATGSGSVTATQLAGWQKDAGWF